ncbi:MAG: hypothetical protein ACE5EL_08680, partial [Anaerolineae bacterium]
MSQDDTVRPPGRGRRPPRRPGATLGAMAAAAGSLALVVAGGRIAGSDTAASTSALPAVFRGHPRLIVGGYRGSTLEDLTAACAAPEMRGQCDQIGGGLMADAMNYLLHSDAAAASRAKSWLVGGVSCGDGVERTVA